MPRKFTAPAAASDWWLKNLTLALGPPEPDGEDRWTWLDGEVGVYITEQTHAWQTLAWTSVSSVTLRTLDRPRQVDLIRVVKLAGLHDEARRPAPADTTEARR